MIRRLLTTTPRTARSLWPILTDGEPARAVLSKRHPENDWAGFVGGCTGGVRGGGRALLRWCPIRKLPTGLEAALSERPGEFVYTAKSGRDRHSHAYVKARLGLRSARLVHAAAYAPVAHLGLVVSWDDGDLTGGAPRPTAMRDVLLLRAQAAGRRPCSRGMPSARRRGCVNRCSSHLAAPRVRVSFHRGCIPDGDTAGA